MENKIQKYIVFSIIGIGTLLMVLLLSADRDSGETMETSNQSITSETDLDNSDEQILLDEIVPTEQNQGKTDTVNSDTTSPQIEYADGKYSSQLDYQVPKGFIASIEVEVEIEEGVVKSVNTSHTAPELDSEFYQQQFDNSYEIAVVGKPLDDISLSRVGGASLTTRAFMSALENISVDAQI